MINKHNRTLFDLILNSDRCDMFLYIESTVNFNWVEQSMLSDAIGIQKTKLYLCLIKESEDNDDNENLKGKDFTCLR